MIFTNDDYTVRPLKVSIGCYDFMRKYAAPHRFIEYCRQCPAYGARWGCPPHDHDWIERLSHYGGVLLLGTKITPRDKALPADAAHDLMRPVTDDLNRRLLDLERERGGVALGFAGKCSYCGETPCTRPQGLPCRHPHLVRPSLEGVGFDVELICRDLLRVPLRWSSDGLLPPYLVVVGAWFHHELCR